MGEAEGGGKSQRRALEGVRSRSRAPRASSWEEGPREAGKLDPGAGWQSQKPGRRDGAGFAFGNRGHVPEPLPGRRVLEP